MNVLARSSGAGRLGLALLALAAAAWPAHGREPALLAVSGGPLGGQLLRGVASETVLGIEYRSRPRGRLKLRPTVGYAAPASSGASFTYAGVQRDFLVTPRWVVTPDVGVGSFEGVEDLNLGFNLEFRLGLESALRFDRGHRLGVALIHWSNGGLSEHNPGIEAVIMSLELAVRR